MSEKPQPHLEEIVEHAKERQVILKTDVQTIMHEAESLYHQHLIEEGRKKLEEVKQKLGK